MPEPCLVLFDDRIARDWQPFTLTRPAGELRFGALTLRERAQRVFGTECIGHLTAEDLLGFEEPDARPVLAVDAVPGDRDVVYLSSRAVPAWTAAPVRLSGGPARILVGGEAAGWFAPAGTPPPPPAFFDDPAHHAPEAPEHALDGVVLDRVWQLVTRNAEQVARDVAALFPDAPRPALPDGVHVLGTAPLVLGPGASVEPGAVIDLRRGPVWLDAGASVAAFSKVAGPAYIGRGTAVLGGPLAAVSIGPVCKVHGEIEESVILGYSNKAHDGFLGHAYLGCWVNLGASTTNSDLKNNYGSVRIWTPGGEVDTGEIKLGCLLGDHVKTAIGTLLNTGTVVGAGSNLFGPGIPPRYVPPFSWGGADPSVAYELERFLASAETAMGRREIALGDGQRALLRRAWHRSRRAP
ncbi:MAG TPA: putative sugar nucleotidyl transferase [Longimicrobiales bacterium]